MARKNLCVIGQVEQTLLDTLTERCIVAAREIGATDAATEKSIASEHPALHLGIKADAALGVTRGADDFEGALSYLDDFAVFQVTIRQATVSQRHSKHFSLLTRTEEIAFHVGMCRYWNAITFPDRSITHNMVDVAVCVDGHQGLEIVAIDKAEEFSLLACR